MKALFSTLGLFVFGCCVSWAAVAPVLPATVVGSYQALLYTGEDNTGTPAGLVTLTPTATGKATGKVTTAENKTYSFTTTFNYVLDSNEGDSLVATSTSTAISIARPKMTPLGLALTIEDHGASVVLKVVLSETGAANRISNSGFRNVKFATGVKASWMGKYTAALEAAEAPVAGEPQGSGYATGIVAATGTMTFAGKTGDGVSFTASLAAGPNMNYVAYLNPYKTAGSFLAGKFTLVARTPTGVHAVAAES
ncbi:MAG TPA: hypothetical protein VD994_16175, partial [Prosthecobacter sp.]|nr:hypothetical protein [Prosthecobacter sp.]